jgi:hypothetical protein
VGGGRVPRPPPPGRGTRGNQEVPPCGGSRLWCGTPGRTTA